MDQRVRDIHIGIDVGGTFTDVAVALPGENRIILYKLPSTPGEPDRAIVDGVRAVLEENGLSAADVVRLAHGTTVGTNALIQRRCGTVAVVTTDGFRDLLEIGRQTRPHVYDMHQDNPAPLVPRRLRIEVPERRLADGATFRPLDESAVAAAGQRLRDEGVDCVVVCFLHSYAYPEHESRAVEILRGILPPEVHVLSSSSVYPEFREYERFSTAVLNGALLTVMNAYLDRFTRNVGALGVASPPKVSQSSGGLMSIDMARSLPIRASLSGPAAGVLGAGVRTRTAGYSNVITLDVGGTSADVSLLRGGVPTEIHERSLAGFPLRMPVLDVNAVGAGGGSIAWIDRDGLLKVGPHSAGARPGPACYDFGGNDATVTDANVVLGRLNDTSLLDGRMPIRRELADRSIASLASQLELDPDETALGIVRVACATIVKAIRTISIERGHDPTEFSLFAFGGAGPLHATDVARELGIAQVIIPPNPGILCAEGLLNSELMSDFVKTVLDELDGDALKSINEARETLLVAASAWFKQEALAPGDRRRVWSAELRYKGQNYELSLPLPDAPLDTDGIAELAKAFHGAHETAYGFASESEPIEFVNIKVKAIGALPEAALPRVEKTEPAQPVATRRTLFRRGESRQETPVFRRRDLARGQRIPGPAIIEQLDTTVIVFPGDVCAVDDWGNLLITLN